MALKIASNNTPAYDYYSEGDGTSPISSAAFCDGAGGTVDSNVVSAYLVADTNKYTNIVVQPISEETGVDWKVSLDNSTWLDSVSPSDMDALAADVVVPIYFKAVAVNDGSLGVGFKTACDVSISFNAYPE